MFYELDYMAASHSCQDATCFIYAIWHRSSFPLLTDAIGHKDAVDTGNFATPAQKGKRYGIQ